METPLVIEESSNNRKLKIILLILIVIGLGSAAGIMYLKISGDSGEDINNSRDWLCGDGLCESGEGESCDNCRKDCGVCDSGDGDPVDKSECDDGKDNDGDGFIDLADSGCIDSKDDDESGESEGIDDSDPLVVQTNFGTVKGKEVGESYSWLGVPFASPPIGDLRFSYAVDPVSWSGVKETRNYVSPCAQLSSYPPKIKDSSEDCLYLYISVPKNREDGKLLPVVVNFHGGSNLYNSPQGDIKGNEDLFVRQNDDVILVSVQYRLGPLGWMPHPAFTDEAGSSGNYGLSDIDKSLEWVQNNIASFGGDPDKVLARGGSSGSINMCAIFASAKGEGKFNSVWMQSWPCVAASRNQKEQSQGVLLSDAIGCTGSNSQIRTCLRNKPWKEIQEMPLTLPEGAFGGSNPVYDPSDPFLKDNPLDIMKAGGQNSGSLIIGAQIHDSWRKGRNIKTNAEMIAKIELILSELVPSSELGESLDKLLAMYPADEQYPSINDKAYEIINDLLFHCPNRRIAMTASSTGTSAYWYIFRQAVVSPDTGNELTVFHGSINPFWNQQIRLGVTPYSISYSPTSGDLKVADYMLNYYTFAAATGNPSNSKSPSWPKVGSGNVLLVEASGGAVSGYHAEQCDYYDLLKG